MAVTLLNLVYELVDKKTERLVVFIASGVFEKYPENLLILVSVIAGVFCVDIFL
jgi:hypothetical protein